MKIGEDGNQGNAFFFTHSISKDKSPSKNARLSSSESSASSSGGSSSIGTSEKPTKTINLINNEEEWKINEEKNKQY